MKKYQVLTVLLCVSTYNARNILVETETTKDTNLDPVKESEDKIPR